MGVGSQKSGPVTNKQHLSSIPNNKQKRKKDTNESKNNLRGIENANIENLKLVADKLSRIQEDQGGKIKLKKQNIEDSLQDQQQSLTESNLGMNRKHAQMHYP